ncbi:PP2C family serine/threonine-protein phosphatase [Ascoidea rubescens DSM 1968]|uniref:Protein serine/threonine phosphatase 2C n=1 Tax=Ascoidea rubescens DSM 1968 TaxID=1344418 RepID=A0A1D2VNX4_9ASCO|nr:protein serine/threonine phosphatase 2C [Ascoidea rubescens DSM 1968]ODV63294.1 protein serine/threonine phosphatase 2C [Ascoidea rubescens DSM 1968]
MDPNSQNNDSKSKIHKSKGIRKIKSIKTKRLSTTNSYKSLQKSEKNERKQSAQIIDYKLSFKVGVSEEKNSKFRKTMEDVHTYISNFNETLDCGYFALFDGHAGVETANWCGKYLHLLLKKKIEEKKISSHSIDIKGCLNDTFQEADFLIESHPNKIGLRGGSTAAVAVVLWEKNEKQTNDKYKDKYKDKENFNDNDNDNDDIKYNKLRKIFDYVPPNDNYKRVLYTANVGDSRIILCRNGFAIRLSYDHKGGDSNESTRIVNSGGMIIRNRVNGILAITRALGDCYMKELVIAKPYTTSLEMTRDDDFLIIACDGLWDIVKDQEAVDLIKDVKDCDKASKILSDYAIKNGSMDNITIMVVRFDQRIFDYKDDKKVKKNSFENPETEKSSRIRYGNRERRFSILEPACIITLNKSSKH